MASKTHLNPEFVGTLVNDQVGQEVHNKINELNLIMANHISDRQEQINYRNVNERTPMAQETVSL